MLEHDGKRVGIVTSAAFSPVRNAVVGLGMIRVTHSQAGGRLRVKSLEGEGLAESIVEDLPMVGHR